MDEPRYRYGNCVLSMGEAPLKMVEKISNCRHLPHFLTRIKMGRATLSAVLNAPLK